MISSPFVCVCSPKTTDWLLFSIVPDISTVKNILLVQKIGRFSLSSKTVSGLPAYRKKDLPIGRSQSSVSLRASSGIASLPFWPVESLPSWKPPLRLAVGGESSIRAADLFRAGDEQGLQGTGVCSFSKQPQSHTSAPICPSASSISFLRRPRQVVCRPI